MKVQNKERIIEFLKIAIPAILESIVTVVITTIDTKMISVLGKQAISAVSLTAQPKLIFFSIFFALGTAVSIFVAQANGRHDAKEGNYYFHAILKITMILSLVLGVLLFFLARPVMLLCNRQADTIELSVSFFRIIMGFLFFQAVSTVLNAALRGLGKTKVTLVSNLVMGVTDILFNYLLIEGHLGFPRLEVQGDAIATVLGTAAACLVSCIALRKQSGFLRLKGCLREKVFTNRENARKIIEKSGNIIFENLFTRIGFLLSSIIVSLLSSEETAVYSVAMILLNYSFAFGDGTQSAVVALSGRSFGAGDKEEFRQYARIAGIFGILCSVILGAVYLATAEPYYHSFFSDQESISKGIQFSFVAALLTVVQILRITQIGILRSMGEVRIPRQLATICVFLVNPLVSYVLTIPLQLGVWGVWAGSVASQGVWLVLSTILCGRYRKKLCM